MAHGKAPKLTSWIFCRASKSTSILVPEWYGGQLLVVLQNHIESVEKKSEKNVGKVKTKQKLFMHNMEI